MRLNGILSIILVVYSVSLYTHAQEPVDASTYNKLLSKVETMYQHATDNHYGWRDTAKIRTAAKLAATGNNFEQAVVLLDKARQQCQLSRQQAEQQMELSKIVPYYLQ